MAKIIKKGTGIIRSFRSATTAGNTEQTEKFLKPSLTVPDESMSVRTILDKYASNTLGDLAFNQKLNYTQDLPDLRGLDIVQLNEMREYAALEVENIETAIKTKKADKKVIEEAIIVQAKTEES